MSVDESAVKAGSEHLGVQAEVLAVGLDIALAHQGEEETTRRGARSRRCGSATSLSVMLGFARVESPDHSQTARERTHVVAIFLIGNR